MKTSGLEISRRWDGLELLIKYLKDGCKTGGVPADTLLSYRNCLTNYLIGSPDLCSPDSEYGSKIKSAIKRIDDAMRTRDSFQERRIEQLCSEMNDVDEVMDVLKSKSYFDRLINAGEIDRCLLEGDVLHMGANKSSAVLLNMYRGDVHIVDGDPRKIDEIAKRDIVPEENIHEEDIACFVHDNEESFDTVALIKRGPMKEGVFTDYREAVDVGLNDNGMGISTFEGTPDKIINLTDKKREKFLSSRSKRKSTYLARKHDFSSSPQEAIAALRKP